MSDYERIQVDTDVSSDNPVDGFMGNLPGISAAQGVNPRSRTPRAPSGTW